MSRDESAHIDFAFAVIDTIRAEEPDLFDAALQRDVYRMVEEPPACEALFAADVIGAGVPGLAYTDMIRYLECVADARLVALGMPRLYNATNPLPFMVLQDTQELTNFFERRVSSYQLGITGSVRFDHSF